MEDRERVCVRKKRVAGDLCMHRREEEEKEEEEGDGGGKGNKGRKKNVRGTEAAATADARGKEEEKEGGRRKGRRRKGGGRQWGAPSLSHISLCLFATCRRNQISDIRENSSVLLFISLSFPFLPLSFLRQRSSVFSPV